jgi:hypothetical protein
LLPKSRGWKEGKVDFLGRNLANTPFGQEIQVNFIRQMSFSWHDSCQDEMKISLDSVVFLSQIHSHIGTKRKKSGKSKVRDILKNP